MEIRGEIDRASPIPLYYQLKDMLQRTIEEDQVPPHSPLPSESSLCDRFRVSRTVVRQTLLELERRGLIYRVKGKGAYVAQPKLSQVIRELTGFSEATRARGEHPTSKVLIQDMSPASETIAQCLNISPGTPIFRLRRVRLADGTPLTVETAHLHFEGCEALLHEDLSDASLYQLLGRSYGIVPSYAEETYEATIVEVRDAPHLGIPPGSAVMLSTRTTYDQEMRPFEFNSGVFRGDRVRFKGVLRRTQKGDYTAE